MAKENPNNPDLLKAQNKDKSQDQQELNLLVQTLQQQIEQQKAQLAILQQQLTQKDDVELKKAQEAERLAAEQLRKDADLKGALSDISDAEDKLEALTNKELIGLIAEAVEKSSEAKQRQMLGLVDSRLSELDGNLKNTQSAIMKIATTMDVKEVRGSHTDFDAYQKEAAELMQQNPGLSVKNAYLLAKAQALEKTPSKQNTDRERPDSTMSRSTVDRTAEATERRSRQSSSVSDARSNRREEHDVSSGVVGFRAILDAGIDRYLAGREE